MKEAINQVGVLESGNGVKRPEFVPWPLGQWPDAKMYRRMT